MGCDIHMYIECRLNESQPWTVSPFHSKEENEDSYLTDEMGIKNDYYMFGLMAGVRGGEALFEERGLPKDCSPQLVEVGNYTTDWHSHSWLTGNELETCINKAYDDLASTDYHLALSKAREWQANELAEALLLRTGAEPEFRFVFWFDN